MPFLSVPGAGKPTRLDIPGSNNPGVRQGIRFLRRVSLYENGYMDRDEVYVREGDKVFVVGCGNTAMDTARTALRMGAAEVTVVYRRTINEMKALRTEYDEAVNEGVKFMWKSNIVKIDSDPHADRLSNITIDTEGTQTTVPADFVILALGSAPASRIVSTTNGLDVDERGYVVTRKEPYGMSSRVGVFAGGDVTERPATVVEAMREAKMVAESIERYVDAVKLMEKIK